MNNLDSLIADLLAAQADEIAQQLTAAPVIDAMEAATQRTLQLGAQLLELRGGNAPFIYAGRLYTFQGSRVTSVTVESVTLSAPAQDSGEVGNA